MYIRCIYMAGERLPAPRQAHPAVPHAARSALPPAVTAYRTASARCPYPGRRRSCLSRAVVLLPLADPRFLAGEEAADVCVVADEYEDREGDPEPDRVRPPTGG